MNNKLLLLLSLLMTTALAQDVWYMPNSEKFDNYSNDLIGKIEGFADTRNVLKKHESSFNELLGQQSVIQKSLSKEETPEYLADKGDLTIYFATFNMKDSAIKDLFYSAVHNNGVVVFRGLKDTTTDIGTTAKYVNQLINKYGFKDKVPNVTINPVLFKQFRVDKAPTIVLQKQYDLGAYKVSGLADSQWLYDKIKERESKGKVVVEDQIYDFGTRGKIVNIAERDMIEEMKERASNYDWESAKKRAFASYMNKIKFIKLPKAKENKAFELDLSMVITKDIYDDKGTIIVTKGTKLDPASYMTMKSYTVVFDGTDEKEVAFAQTVKARADDNNVGSRFIASEFHLKNGGWKDLQSLRDVLGGMVYKLDKHFMDRFQIKSTPSVIYMRDGKVYIEEVSL